MGLGTKGLLYRRTTKAYPWLYYPGVADIADPTIIKGQAIAQGAKVRKATELNPPMYPTCFCMIEDEQGNVQSVWRNALRRA